MHLAEILRLECIAPAKNLTDKDQALREVVRLARKSPLLKNVKSQRILEGLEDREWLGSTGFGNGIAIPHCRLPEVSDFVVGAIVVPDGVDFEAVDEQKVKVIAFIIGPESETTDHLRALSALSLSLGASERLKKVLASESAADVYQAIIQGTSKDLSLKGHANKRLIHVIIQDEELVNGVLGAFESLESASVVVLDGRSSGEYLARIPLFAGLFLDDNNHFCKTAIAVINRDMTNEAIRRIEEVVGSLDQCTNVMVVVQDVFYASGSLQV
jgi:mannitol/fructose-specific phosphotransferase system IIA component (Ntr-type)